VSGGCGLDHVEAVLPDSVGRIGSASDDVDEADHAVWFHGGGGCRSYPRTSPLVGVGGSAVIAGSRASVVIIVLLVDIGMSGFHSSTRCLTEAPSSA
jgi:hypothetical protein